MTRGFSRACQAFLAALASVGATTALAADDPVSRGGAPPAAESITTLLGANASRVPGTVLKRRWSAASTPRIRKAAGPWAGLMTAARGRTKTEQLELVNRWVNRAIHFREDGAADRWAGIAETMSSGRGDCEDYAVAKLQLLRALGHSTRDLYILIVRDVRLAQDHAVLLARSGPRLMLLDNQRDEIVDANTLLDYRPILAFNVSDVWLYRPGGASRPAIERAS